VLFRSLFTKTDGSLGRVKSALPGSDPSPDLDYYVTAAEHERLKDRIIEAETEIGLSDGSTAGSLREAINAITSGFAYTLVTGATHTIADANSILAFDPSAGSTVMTLPVPTAGRIYIIRKIDGLSTETITLARNATESIDGTAASRLLPNSDTEVSLAASAQPSMAWLVWSNGTDWFTATLGAGFARSQLAAVDPDDTVHNAAAGYWPGSIWHNTATRQTFIAMCSPSLSNISWHRVDAVGVLSVITTAVTLPSKDRQVFVNTATAGGVVSLTLPDPTGRNTGRQFVITRVNATGTNKITMVRAATEQINGVAASFDLPGSDTADYGRWHVVSDGTSWWVTGGSGLV
jgi:hypothetical protein